MAVAAIGGISVTSIYLIEASLLLAEKYPELADTLGVMVLGAASAEYAESFPFPIYCLGYVNDERELVDIYNAADLYVTPSLQDNLPNTIVEAMSCGTPCLRLSVVFIEPNSNICLSAGNLSLSRASALSPGQNTSVSMALGISVTQCPSVSAALSASDASHNLFGVDIASSGSDITSLQAFKEADVIHLHWVNI